MDEEKQVRNEKWKEEIGEENLRKHIWAFINREGLNQKLSEGDVRR